MQLLSAIVCPFFGYQQILCHGDLCHLAKAYSHDRSNFLEFVAAFFKFWEMALAF